MLRRWLARLHFDDLGGLSLAFALLLSALFVPTFELPRTTYDYLVVFDITQSMNVQDYELDGIPVDRLAYAKHAVRTALPKLPCGSRIGWGAFAEYRTVVLLAPVEVCSSYNDLITSLDKIDGRMRWGEASEIRKGVFWSLRAARDLGTGANVILFTDGQEAPPLDSTRPEVALFDDITEGMVAGWLVGVGGQVPRPIPKTDPEGNVIGYWRAHEVIQRATDPAGSVTASNEHLSAMQEAHLQTLARQIGFHYRRLGNLEDVQSTFNDPRFARRAPVPTDLSWLPAAFALLVLAVRFRPVSVGCRLKAVARSARYARL